jgi:hypothetical protein
MLVSDLQFGFKSRHSISMCTMVLKKTISYNVTNNSSVYCSFLDASSKRLFLTMLQIIQPFIVRSWTPAKRSIVFTTANFFADMLNVGYRLALL